MAAVNFNPKGLMTSTFQKFKYSNAQPAILSLEASRKRKVKQNAIKIQRNGKKRKVDDSQGNKEKKKRYGDGHEDLDYSPRELELAKVNLLDQLDMNRRNRINVEVMTRGQRYNSKWSEVRQNLLTSSYFGRILNARNRTSYTKIVDDILYHNHQYSNTADLAHQRLHESSALRIFKENYTNEQVHSCGIFIDAEYSFLGASPFRVVGTDALLMVQCPIKLYNKSINNAISEKKIQFWNVRNGETVINVKSAWYIEIQGQLHISEKEFAYIVVYLSDTEYKIETIVRDDDYWEKEIKEELIFG